MSLEKLLIETEQRYTEQCEVERKVISPFDPRLGNAAAEAKMAKSGMTGGDKFTKHGYAPVYAKALQPFIGKQITIVEIGVLQGVSLAVWCDLFPTSRIIGLDIDLSHYEENKHKLLERGAFQKNTPEVYKFDELADGTDKLKEILGARRKINICIDDALHIKECALQLEEKVRPLMAKKSAYIVEDISGICDFLPDCSFGDGKIGVIAK